jgi:hypothetical protein
MSASPVGAFHKFGIFDVRIARLDSLINDGCGDQRLLVAPRHNKFLRS